MPIVVVTAATPPDGVTTALVRITSAVSSALGLPADGVHAVFVQAAHAVTGSDVGQPWPHAVLYGGRREETAMAAAAAAVERELSACWATDPSRVWVQWCVREPIG